MQCVWWNHRSIIDFEFLKRNQILNADLYSQQLQHVHENLGEKLCNSLITQSHIQLESCRKIVGFRRVCTTQCIILTRPSTNWFPSLLFSKKMLWVRKNSHEVRMKTFDENLLNSKTAEFYLRGINKLRNEWQKVILDNGEYTDWLKLILLKQKLFMTQPNINVQWTL